MFWKILAGVVQLLLALVTFWRGEQLRQEGRREVLYDLEQEKVDALRKAQTVDSRDTPRDKHDILDGM